MSSSFLAFLAGQLFNAFCTSIHHLNVESVPAVVVSVDAGFSFKMVTAIVLSVLVVHDLAILLVLRYLYSCPKYQPKVFSEPVNARHIPLLLPPVPHSIPPSIVTFRRTALLLPPLPVNILSPARTAFRIQLPILSVPRPFWRLNWRILHQPPITAFIPRAVLPLIQSSTALALTAVPHPGDFMPSFVHLRGLDTGSPTSVTALEIRSTTGDVDVPANAHRHSHTPLLRHIAAAALLRKLQFQVVDEPCHGSVEEDAGVVSAEQIEEVVEIEAVEDAPLTLEEIVDKVIELIEIEEAVEDSTPTLEEVLSEEAGAVQKIEEAEKIEEVAEIIEVAEGIEEADQDTTPTLVKKMEIEKEIEVVAYENKVGTYEELDDFPSYEEFVNEAPPEPLFEKRTRDVVGYIVFRPPDCPFRIPHWRQAPQHTPSVSASPSRTAVFPWLRPRRGGPTTSGWETCPDRGRLDLDTPGHRSGSKRHPALDVDARSLVDAFAATGLLFWF
ncbi:hypothetical protein B0H14DRAFT_3043238 [Mycena olivaceomarginata]|nr:hypothetical protein B0H14DRAFT_3043238 [Mycena olivaceomarginata]